MIPVLNHPHSPNRKLILFCYQEKAPATRRGRKQIKFRQSFEHERSKSLDYSKRWSFFRSDSLPHTSVVTRWLLSSFEKWIFRFSVINLFFVNTKKNKNELRKRNRKYMKMDILLILIRHCFTPRREAHFSAVDCAETTARARYFRVSQKFH